MGKDNGMKLVTWVIGIIVFLITIYSQFHVPLANAINSEEKCRVANDARILEIINNAILKQNEAINNAEIKRNEDMKVLLVAMQEIKTELKYAKRNFVDKSNCFGGATYENNKQN